MSAKNTEDEHTETDVPVKPQIRDLDNATKEYLSLLPEIDKEKQNYQSIRTDFSIQEKNYHEVLRKKNDTEGEIQQLQEELTKKAEMRAKYESDSKEEKKRLDEMQSLLKDSRIAVDEKVSKAKKLEFDGPELQQLQLNMKADRIHPTQVYALGDLHGWAPGLINYLTTNQLAKIRIGLHRLWIENSGNQISVNEAAMRSLFPDPYTSIHDTGEHQKAGLSRHPSGFWNLEGIEEFNVEWETAFHDIHAEWIGKPTDVFIQVGDVFDRGDHSEVAAEIIRQLLLQAPANIFVLMGNHEQFLLESDFEIWHHNEVNYTLATPKDTKFTTRLSTAIFDFAGDDTDAEDKLSRLVFQRYRQSAAVMYLTQFFVKKKFAGKKVVEFEDFLGKPYTQSQWGKIESDILAGGWKSYQIAENILDGLHAHAVSTGSPTHFPGGLVALGIGHTLFVHAEPNAYNIGTDEQLPKCYSTPVDLGCYPVIWHNYKLAGDIQKSNESEFMWARGASENYDEFRPRAISCFESLLEFAPGLRHYVHGHSPVPLDHFSNSIFTYLARDPEMPLSSRRGNVRVFNIDEGMTPVYHGFEEGEGHFDAARTPIGLCTPEEIVVHHNWSDEIEKDTELWNFIVNGDTKTCVFNLEPEFQLHRASEIGNFSQRQFRIAGENSNEGSDLSVELGIKNYSCYHTSEREFFKNGYCFSMLLLPEANVSQGTEKINYYRSDLKLNFSPERHLHAILDEVTDGDSKEILQEGQAIKQRERIYKWEEKGLLASIQRYGFELELCEKEGIFFKIIRAEDSVFLILVNGTQEKICSRISSINSPSEISVIEVESRAYRISKLSSSDDYFWVNISDTKSSAKPSGDFEKLIQHDLNNQSEKWFLRMKGIRMAIGLIRTPKRVSIEKMDNSNYIPQWYRYQEDRFRPECVKIEQKLVYCMKLESGLVQEFKKISESIAKEGGKKRVMGLLSKSQSPEELMRTTRVKIDSVKQSLREIEGDIEKFSSNDIFKETLPRKIADNIIDLKSDMKENEKRMSELEDEYRNKKSSILSSGEESPIDDSADTVKGATISIAKGVKETGLETAENIEQEIAVNESEKEVIGGNVDEETTTNMTQAEAISSSEFIDSFGGKYRVIPSEEKGSQKIEFVLDNDLDYIEMPEFAESKVLMHGEANPEKRSFSIIVPKGYITLEDWLRERKPDMKYRNLLWRMILEESKEIGDGLRVLISPSTIYINKDDESEIKFSGHTILGYVESIEKLCFIDHPDSLYLAPETIQGNETDIISARIFSLGWLGIYLWKGKMETSIPLLNLPSFAQRQTFLSSATANLGMAQSWKDAEGMIKDDPEIRDSFYKEDPEN